MSNEPSYELSPHSRPGLRFLQSRPAAFDHPDRVPRLTYRERRNAARQPSPDDDHVERLCHPVIHGHTATGPDVHDGTTTGRGFSETPGSVMCSPLVPGGG
ncbi:hypothetical protein GCM10010409_11950 [Mycolicibacterium diernhoferi]